MKNHIEYNAVTFVKLILPKNKKTKNKIRHLIKFSTFLLIKNQFILLLKYKNESYTGIINKSHIINPELIIIIFFWS